MLISSILAKIPYGIAFLILAAGLWTLLVNVGKIPKKAFIPLLKRAKYVTAGTLAVTIFLSSGFAIANHVHQKNFSSAIISLNYSRASSALNSNGTRFNMAEITCDEVLSRAIELGALEDVTVNELRKCLSAAPLVQGNVSDKEKWHISTEFVLQYAANSKTRHLDAENVIQLLTMSYKEYYINKYVDTYVPYTEGEEPDFSKMEYLDTVAYLQKEATSLLNYLYSLGDAAPSFVTEDENTFHAIAGKVYQFNEITIDQNLRSLILQNGIARDSVGYVDRLSYQNKNTAFEKEKNSISFSLCGDAIDLYAEDMTRVVLVPTWDGSGKYYMGRTKVGVDELSVMATDYSAKASDNEKSILDNNLIIGKLSMQKGGEAERAEADRAIAATWAELESYTRMAVEAGREYNAYRLNGCVGLRTYGSNLFGEAKNLCIFGVITLFATAVYALGQECKREKKKIGG